MNKSKLNDGLELYCLRKTEALVLDSHVDGYFQHGIQIKNGDVIFDVGANIGIFGLRVCHRFPQAQVFAFEPIPDIFKVLKKNAELHGQGRFHCFEVGISEEEGSAEFTYYPNSPALSTSHQDMWEKDPDMWLKAVKGSLEEAPKGYRWVRFLPDFMIRWIANFLVSGSKKFKCTLVPLSQIIESHQVNQIDLLKIDCEGAELFALKSIHPNFWPQIKQVVVEVHDQDGRLETIKNMLEGYGFSKITIDKEKALKETALYNLYAVK